MKILKLRNLLVLAALGSLVTFSSCDGDDGSEPDPTLNFIGDTTTISPGDDATIKSGETARFSWTISNGGSDLTRFTIDYVPPGGSSTQIFDSSNLSDNNATEYSDMFGITLTETGEHNFTFRIEEENGNSTERSITVTVESGAPLESYTARMVGAQNSTDFGSFYSVRKDSVYFATGFNTSNGQFIDLIYYYGATNSATLASPSDQTVEEFDAYDVTQFNQRNETVFSPISGNIGDFQTASDLDQFESALNNSNVTKANELSTGSTYAFKLDNDKLGVFAVQKIDSEDAGFIEIDVKVQP
jgi:hypothetical protein